MEEQSGWLPNGTYTGEEAVLFPSSRWLMSVVGSPGSPVVLMTGGVVLNVQVRCEGYRDAKSSARCLASVLSACRR